MIPAQPQYHMVPDCSRSGLVAQGARMSYLDPDGMHGCLGGHLWASAGQAKFRALAQLGKDTVWSRRLA